MSAANSRQAKAARRDAKSGQRLYDEIRRTKHQEGYEAASVTLLLMGWWIGQLGHLPPMPARRSSPAAVGPPRELRRRAARSRQG